MYQYKYTYRIDILHHIFFLTQSKSLALGRKMKSMDIERMLNMPIEELGLDELQQLSEFLEFKMMEIEFVVMQQMVCSIVFPYEILGSALAPSGDD